jgi:hypothetical protein
MWRMCMSILVSSWILTTPAIWAHRWEQALLSAVVGLLGIVLAFAAVIRPGLRTAVFALGAVRALSAFAFPDSWATTADTLTTGLLLVIGGMYPEMVVVPAAAQVSQPMIRRATESVPADLAA